MKKSFFLFALFTCSFSSFSQNCQCLKLQILNRNDTVESEKQLKQTLKFTNNCKFSILLPGTWGSIPKSDYTPLNYDIVFLDEKGDEVLLTTQKLTPSKDVFRTHQIPDSVLLNPKDSININIYLDYIYFKKVGNYKIRFYLKANQFNKKLKPIITEWKKIYLKRPIDL